MSTRTTLFAKNPLFSLLRVGYIALVLLALAMFLPGASAQTDPGAQIGPSAQTSREAMWPAPTAKDWKLPCLITWQRTWEDAQAVSKETGKPILVCVNMDGEIASEHYAGIRYRQPDIAALYEPYVCVIASVYRHTPRDYSEEGNRILCPRFGCITCGEHIEMERTLYGKFFDETRVAPRHIGVELDGKETYDVYYAFDTDSVFKAIQDGIANREFVAPTVVRGDRSIVERVASRDIADRKAVEKAYSQGDHTLRRALLEAAIEHPDVEQVDLLRSAVFGFDMELSSLARQALARTESKASVDLITEALRVPMDVSERDALIGALARLGESAPRARMLAVVHKGLSARSKVLDVAAWTGALGAVEDDGGPAELDTGLARLAKQNAVLRSGDGAARLELAETFLASAYEQIETEEEYARCLFADARSTALEAEKCGADGWRADAVVGLAAFTLGDRDEADRRAEAAARAMPPGETGWKAKAVLELFAAARRRSIAGAVRAKRDWESWSKAFEGTGEWLTDLHAAYSILARHPFGTDTHVVAHFDFLKILGAKAQAAQVLDEGLIRFPESWVLHDRLRGRILAEKGIDGLETCYEEMLGTGEASAGLESFAGYASFVAAEFRRRYGNAAEALAAYDRAIARYEHAIEADGAYRETADHFIALAIAGRSRLALERGDYETALDELLLSFARRGEAAATLDGLNISPADTARMLLSRLKAAERDDLVARLEEAMGKLDPELLRLPAYERRGPGGTRPERAGRDRRGRRPGDRRMPRRNG